MNAPPLRIAIDVSNTLDSRRVSGLQRLALRVSGELQKREDVVLELLDGRSGRQRRLVGGHRRLLTHFDRPQNRVRDRAETRLARRIPLGPARPPSPGQWLVDIEPSWHAPQSRADLLPTLVRSGGQSAAVVPDLLPVLHPEWFPEPSVRRFTSWLEAHREAGSRWFAISDATAAALGSWLAESNGEQANEVAVLRLGVDPVPANRPIPTGGLLLMLGTVEPRKGHGLLLDALDLLGSRSPIVDVVGSPGWAADDLLHRLEGHPKVRWHRSVTDDDLNQLLGHTSLLLQPSFGEGFGLPVAEALARGIPVMATNLAVLEEAAKGNAFLVAPDAGDWAATIERFLDDPAFGNELRHRAGSFTPFGWADTADDLVAGLRPDQAS